MANKNKKISFYLVLILILTILGGCTAKQEQDEQQIIEKAKEETIQYFKKTEGLEVSITDHEFGPKDFQTISISGYVTNDKTKEFTASVEYTNNYHIGAISTTKNLELKN
ncbi:MULTISPECIES: DUF1433 domain-containing protein [Bacillus cereus group]|uniref:DUF1433 domain-containing protein n=1 Tax=Bacillus thuringiensis serovar sooncheon TaxID=180891 RepID=A0A9Q5SHX8_BACTU|nr:MULTISPECIES: DUF1433 domain-containing protein [Bacillus cereus group]OTW67680.1 DUF1433 domain-containing protein [Bacillus thuringiensis serovar coreanensis]OTX44297.1 DUF1433 domain-containing protein [Bacillus thuringiensis serovar sooncheon]OTX53460.1 DUF1433 domain-containing protein [Bacillus thuringiensis serovar guiyangiensis]OTX67781.1 DUF1433 domain-containing protein [Bacillus thuringiensis serovar roskildiensis]